MEINDRLQELLDKYFQRSLTAEQETELLAYFDQADTLAEIEERLGGEFEREEGLSGFDERRKEEMLHYIFKQHRDLHPVRRMRRVWPRIVAAAVALLFLSAGGYFLLRQAKKDQQAVSVVHDIKPGGNKAFLTLADGKRISLNDASRGTIASQAGNTVRKTSEGTIVYDHSHDVHHASGEVYNTIETPRGGQYEVVLPDGTRVWLNAASSLKYPAAFTQNERRVDLSGEAYFEVAKDKRHPFIVASNRQEVQVLGTHFNINAYNDEATTKTTLLEGSVQITSDGASKVLVPGNQAVAAGDKLMIRNVDTGLAVAWKNNKFIFERQDLREIMRTIGRWYNVEVVYTGTAPTETFYGSVSRFDNVSTVLRQLEASGNVHFKVEGQKIYVLSK
jgi:ferric-dicitrate binding protein FerR (iron transport regulator)